MPGQSGPGSQWQWRGAPHFPKLQHHWNLIIRLFSVISRTLIGRGEVLPLCRGAVGVFYRPSRLSKKKCCGFFLHHSYITPKFGMFTKTSHIGKIRPKIFSLYLPYFSPELKRNFPFWRKEKKVGTEKNKKF